MRSLQLSLTKLTFHGRWILSPLYRLTSWMLNFCLSALDVYRKWVLSLFPSVPTKYGYSSGMNKTWIGRFFRPQTISTVYSKKYRFYSKLVSHMWALLQIYRSDRFLIKCKPHNGEKSANHCLTASHEQVIDRSCFSHENLAVISSVGDNLDSWHTKVIDHGWSRWNRQLQKWQN